MAESVRAVFRRVVLFLFILLISLPVFYGTTGNLSHKSYLLALMIAGMFFMLIHLYAAHLKKFCGGLMRFRPAAACAVLSLICLVVNGGFALMFHPVQAADYRTFFQVAKDLSKGVHPGMKDYVAMFPHILGYASFLSLFLKLFGQSLTVAVGVNVLLTTLSGIILFHMVYRQMDLCSAAAVYLLWILCPSKLFYNTMTLSEPYYTFLILLFFLLFQQTEGLLYENGRKRFLIIVLIAVACGGILTLIQAARPIALIPIIALVLWICFLMDGNRFRKQWKGWAVFVLVLLLSYGAGGCMWRAYATEQLEQAPPAVPGYNIYVGFNLETNGSYSDTDMELLQSRYFGEYERNAEAAQQSMLQDAKLRIAEAKPVMPRLMLIKLKTLLGHDEGGVFYAMESLSNGQYSLCCIVSNIWYYLAVMLAVSGCLEIWRRGEKKTILVCILFAIGLILAQLLVEVAARYHYVLIPILLLTAGFAFQRIRDGQIREE